MGNYGGNLDEVWSDCSAGHNSGESRCSEQQPQQVQQGEFSHPDSLESYADITHEAASEAAGARRSQTAHQARRLISAANELLALAAELEAEIAPVSPLPNEASSDEETRRLLEDDVRWLRHARRTYRNRRSRGALFGNDTLFGEPAWDLLLDLFIAAKERKRVPVTSACIGAAVPTTTALRWLSLLEDKGLVVREADPTDARRIFVRLTADAYAKMIAYFARAAGIDTEDTIEAARAQGRELSRGKN